MNYRTINLLTLLFVMVGKSYASSGFHFRGNNKFNFTFGNQPIKQGKEKKITSFSPSPAINHINVGDVITLVIFQGTVRQSDTITGMSGDKYFTTGKKGSEMPGAPVTYTLTANKTTKRNKLAIVKVFRFPLKIENYQFKIK